MPDVLERAEPDNAAGPSFVPYESAPSSDEKFKVKEECFDDESYIHDWAKKQFIGVPLSWTCTLPMGGLIIQNNYSFSPRQVLCDGLTHMGITFQEYSKEFSETLEGLQRMRKVRPLAPKY